MSLSIPLGLPSVDAVIVANWFVAIWIATSSRSLSADKCAMMIRGCEDDRQAGSALFTNLLNQHPRESVQASLYQHLIYCWSFCRWQTGVCFVCFQKRLLHGCTHGHPIFYIPHLAIKRNSPWSGTVSVRRASQTGGLPVWQTLPSSLSHLIYLALPLLWPVAYIYITRASRLHHP
jgi:hypothetical protein